MLSVECFLKKMPEQTLNTQHSLSQHSSNVQHSTILLCGCLEKLDLITLITLGNKLKPTLLPYQVD